MAKYIYVGRSINGVKKGKIDAVNESEATIKLKKKGIRVKSIEKQKVTALTKEFSLGKQVKRKELIMFLGQFSTLLKSGVSIVDSINIIAKQVKSKKFKKVLADVERDIVDGDTLSEAFKKHPKVFETLTLNMVQAGELTGTLEESLGKLSNYYEKSHQNKQKIISALIYPVIVGVMAIGVVIFLLTFIIPMFVDMFDSIGGELPWLTKTIMSLSDGLIAYWYVIIGLLLLMGSILFMGLKTVRGRNVLDNIVLRLPIFGSLLVHSNMVTFTRTLSSMFTSSVPILQSLEMTEKVINNGVIKKVIMESRKSIERGESLSKPMENHWAIPPIVPHMIDIGEKTGTIDTMLDKVADYYEKEVDTTTERLKAMIEPIMIVGLSLVVGVIVISVMLPMFSIFGEVDNM